MNANTSPSPIGYITKEDLANLRTGVSCVDLFGSVVPKGFEMIPVYVFPSPLPHVVGGEGERFAQIADRFAANNRGGRNSEAFAAFTVATEIARAIREASAPSPMVGSEIEKAVSLGASVLARIEDPAAREIAIRNALTVAVEGLAVVPQGAVPVRASEQARIDAYKASTEPHVSALSELDEMVSSAIEAAIETSPEFNHGWRSMSDKKLIPEILDEIPIEYTEDDIAAAIYRYKGRAALPPAPSQELMGQETVAIDRSLLEAAIAEIRGWKVAKGGDDQVVLNLEAALTAKEGSTDA